MVLTCCPPFPLALITSIRISSGLNVLSYASDSLSSPILGSTTTAAVDVCVLPFVSVAGTLCTRCTPASNFNLSYEPGSSMFKIASNTPVPLAFSVLDIKLHFHLW